LGNPQPEEEGLVCQNIGKYSNHLPQINCSVCQYTLPAMIQFAVVDIAITSSRLVLDDFDYYIRRKLILVLLVAEIIGNHLKAKPRQLTQGEMAMVTSVFKTAITLTEVRVRKDPILPF
jgi:hypothetical protein